MPQVFDAFCTHGVSLEARCHECDKENSRGLLDNVESWAAQKQVRKELRYGAIIFAVIIILIVLFAL